MDPNATMETDNTVMIQEAGHTIRGQGRLLNNTGGMINRGSIVGDTGSLEVHANGLGFHNDVGGTVFGDVGEVAVIGPGVNDGTIQAVNGGTARIHPTSNA